MAVHGAFDFGKLSALDDEFWVNVPDTASALVKVVGDFDGVLQIDGSGFIADQAKSSGVVGPRIVYKSGVGSLGENKIRNYGASVEDEYRVLTGGQSIRIKMVEWTSGMAVVRVFASHQPSIVYVNGPVHDAQEEAVRARRAFVAGFSDIAVTSNNRLDFTIENPSNSGVNLFLTERLFGHDASQVLKYEAWAGEVTDLANTVSAVNRFIGGPASEAVFKYEVVSASSDPLGTAEGTGEPIHPNDIRERRLLAVLPPDVIIGFSINGVGANINQASRLFATLQWYEEPIN